MPGRCRRCCTGSTGNGPPLRYDDPLGVPVIPPPVSDAPLGPRQQMLRSAGRDGGSSQGCRHAGTACGSRPVRQHCHPGPAAGTAHPRRTPRHPSGDPFRHRPGRRWSERPIRPSSLDSWAIRRGARPAGFDVGDVRVGAGSYQANPPGHEVRRAPVRQGVSRAGRSTLRAAAGPKRIPRPATSNSRSWSTGAASRCCPAGWMRPWNSSASILSRSRRRRRGSPDRPTATSAGAAGIRAG
jgi:hypothetical protein